MPWWKGSQRSPGPAFHHSLLLRFDVCFLWGQTEYAQPVVQKGFPVMQGIFWLSLRAQHRKVRHKSVFMCWSLYQTKIFLHLSLRYWKETSVHNVHKAQNLYWWVQTMTVWENRSLLRGVYVTLVVIIAFIVTVAMMSLGELKQLNEKLLKQIQGENF